MDVVLYVSKKATDRIYQFLTYGVFFAVYVMSGEYIANKLPSFEPLTPNLWVFFGAAFILFLIGDFANFLSHYLQHRVPLLWELHKVHHSATFLNPLTTGRQHPLGDAFDGLFGAILKIIPISLLFFLYHLSVVDLFILAGSANLIGTLLVLDPLRHSHFPVSFGPLNQVILSPHMHQLHHSSLPKHWDMNFGNKLSIFDRLFGTIYIPGKNEEIIYGLGKPEEAEYNSFFGAYLGPITKAYRLAFSSAESRPYPDAAYAGATDTDHSSFMERVLWRTQFGPPPLADVPLSTELAPAPSA